MKLAVEGMACLGSFGDSLEALHKTPVRQGLDEQDSNGALVCGPRADTERLARYFPARSLRQMDHVTRMALLCACDALADAGLAAAGTSVSLPPDTGIILVSGYGPASPTLDFLDSILEHGELMASPLSFSHSVHNIPAAQIAIKLNAAGPSLSLCQLECPVTAGLLAASGWLATGKAGRVLFGAVDEHTPLLAHISGRMAEKRQSQGKTSGRSRLFLGEGAAFFLLNADGNAARHGFFSQADMWTGADERETPGKQADGTPGRLLLSGLIPDTLTTLRGGMVLAERYGNIPVAQAFDAAFCLSAQPGAGDAVCLACGPGGQRGGFHVEPLNAQTRAGNAP